MLQVSRSRVEVNSYKDVLWALLKSFIAVSECTPPVPSIPISVTEIARASSIFALIIGINKYTTLQKLNGAVADAERVRCYLRTLKVPDDQIQYLSDSYATRHAIIGALKGLQHDPRIKRDKSCILIFYAGHGSEKDAPPSWVVGGSKVQIILPVDYGEKLDNGVVLGIPDRTIGRLLDKLAEKKGNNITVIFDCCHSGSGTRADHDRMPRSVKVLNDIPADLDQSIWGSSDSYRGTKYEPGFLHKGLRSHVFLAACSAKEIAFEDKVKLKGRVALEDRVVIHGTFTHTLFSVLEAISPDQLTYAGLLNQMDAIPAQNPQCEGYHRDRTLFDAMAQKSQNRDLYVVRRNGKDKYRMHAGAAHGITEGAQFTVYQDRASALQGGASGLGILLVHKASAFISEMRSPSSASPLNFAEGVALQTKAGARSDIHLHVPLDDRFVAVFNAVGQLMESTDARHWQISLVERDQATLDITLENGHFVFNILDERVTQHGLTRIPYPVEIKVADVHSVLSAAAHYYWHLNHTNNIHHLSDKVKIEFKTLKDIQDEFDEDFNALRDVRGEKPLEAGILRVDADTDDLYGMKIINNSLLRLYVSVFYFDNSNLSIAPYYQPGVAGKSNLDPCLERNGAFLTIGYGAGGSPSFRYSMEGLPVDQQVDVGFIKVFLTTDPVDLSNVPQESPFTSASRMNVTVMRATAKLWDTILIPVVQRRTV